MGLASRENQSPVTILSFASTTVIVTMPPLYSESQTWRVRDSDCVAAPEPAPLVYQIFNWSETPEVTEVRLNTVLEAAGLNASSARYLAFYSADGMYFESLPKTLANDPRMLLVYGICGGPLLHELGGPVRLWAPFLQGYKSVKWLRDVRSFVRDPTGIKRLLGQSKTAVLGAPGQQKASVVVAKVGSDASVNRASGRAYSRRARDP